MDRFQRLKAHSSETDSTTQHDGLASLSSSLLAITLLVVVVVAGITLGFVIVVVVGGIMLGFVAAVVVVVGGIMLGFAFVFLPRRRAVLGLCVIDVCFLVSVSALHGILVSLPVSAPLGILVSVPVAALLGSLGVSALFAILNRSCW